MPKWTPLRRRWDSDGKRNLVVRVKLTGDISMVLHPRLDLYDPDRPIEDLYQQLIIWGDQTYVCHLRR